MGYHIKQRTAEQQKGLDELYEARDAQARKERQSAERDAWLAREEAQAKARMARLNRMPSIAADDVADDAA